MVKWDYKNIKDCVNSTDCTLLSDEDEFLNLKTMLKKSPSHTPVRVLCKCGEEFEVTMSNFNHKTKQQNCCRKCRVKKSVGYTYEDIKKYIHEKGCELLSTEEEFEEAVRKHKKKKNIYARIYVRCSCGSAYSTNFHQFKYSNHEKCEKCSNELKSTKLSYSYKEIKEFVELNSCQLITTEECFNRVKQRERTSNVKTKINIKCSCGECFTTAFDTFLHANKRQCNKCGWENVKNNHLAYTYEEIKEKIDMDGNGNELLTTKKEFYSLRRKMNKGGVWIPLKIKCSCENTFSTNYHTYKSNHTQKCPVCWDKKSKGEERIKEVLLKSGAIFDAQVKIDGCKNKTHLPFDFCVYDNNGNIKALIEYQGEQHFKSVKYFGGFKKYRERKLNDMIKRRYCADNNIKLIEIPYTKFNDIEIILENARLI